MYQNTVKSDDFDSLTASASVAVSIAAAWVLKAEKCAAATANATEILLLPKWRDDAQAWLGGLRNFIAANQSDGRGQRSQVQQLFMRVCDSAAMASQQQMGAESRHRYLALACVYAGALSGFASVQGEIEGIDAAVKEAIKKQTSNATKQRVKVQAMRAVKAEFKEWRDAPGKRKTWTTWKDFGRWAADSYELDAAYVARMAGCWEKERSAAIAAGREWP